MFTMTRFETTWDWMNESGYATMLRFKTPWPRQNARPIDMPYYLCFALLSSYKRKISKWHFMILALGGIEIDIKAVYL